MSKKLAARRVRDDARSLLRGMIVSGELAPETHVEEIKLSEQIGVSRTPVREALIALEEEGLVASQPRRGFVVVRPDAGLVRESFPIVGALEAMAVRLGGERLQQAAPKLRAINTALRAAKTKARQYDLDRAFHVALTEHCANARMLRLLTMERARIQLIDGHHKRGMANLEGSCIEHESVIAALERGESAEASQVLTQHWQNGVEVVVKWIKEKR